MGQSPARLRAASVDDASSDLSHLLQIDDSQGNVQLVFFSLHYDISIGTVRSPLITALYLKLLFNPILHGLLEIR